MGAVTLTRTIDAPPAAVRDAIDDVGPFVEAAGFDSVDVEGKTIRVENSVGVATIELTLKVVDDPHAALAYEQREGIFETMKTRYSVTPVGDGATSEVEATTTFSLAVPVVGGVLDATVIERQRQRELAAQLDWLETMAETEMVG